jgi:hypothetical protein
MSPEVTSGYRRVSTGQASSRHSEPKGWGPLRLYHITLCILLCTSVASDSHHSSCRSHYMSPEVTAAVSAPLNQVPAHHHHILVSTRHHQHQLVHDCSGPSCVAVHADSKRGVYQAHAATWRPVMPAVIPTYISTRPPTLFSCIRHAAILRMCS